MSKVYLIHAVGTDLFKIGVATDVGNRLANLQTASPFELRVTATRDGGARLERTIHNALAEHRVRGEWFRGGCDIIEIFASTKVSNKSVRAHAEAIRSCGSAKYVAKSCDVSIHTVRSWIARNSIPGEYWLWVSQNGEFSLHGLAESASA